MITRDEAFAEINRLQNEYIDELIAVMNDPAHNALKMINFTSPTGTGKTKMMSKLINRFPDIYFIVTTLSKGQLHIQIRDSLTKDCPNGNFYVYGSCDYKINSKLDADDIIGRIPVGTKCIWLRDEGHIKTNRWDALLEKVCYKVVNFSATNERSDIQCNFTSTMMLRTVVQSNGTPVDAMRKLMEIKESHAGVPGYNPCAIFRCVSGNHKLYDMIVELCDKYGLKHIDITDAAYDMADLCRDDNEYDVIINKFKIVEGIDIRRAHVLYMDNQPANDATTIQVIGRCRRNALLYRSDVNILSPANTALLKNTRECYVYYNVDKMRISTDAGGELQYAFCDHVSCEALKPNSIIDVVDGQLANGLYVLELSGETGAFVVQYDERLQCNYVSPETKFYTTQMMSRGNYLYSKDWKIALTNVSALPLITSHKYYNYSTGEWTEQPLDDQYYIVEPYPSLCSVMGEDITVSKDVQFAFLDQLSEFQSGFQSILCFYDESKVLPDIMIMQSIVDEYLRANKSRKRQQQSAFFEIVCNVYLTPSPYRWDLYDVLDVDSELCLQYCLIQLENKYPSRTKSFAQHLIARFLNACETCHLNEYSHDNHDYRMLVQNLICYVFTELETWARGVWPRAGRLFSVQKKDGHFELSVADVTQYFATMTSQIQATPVPMAYHGAFKQHVMDNIGIVSQQILSGSLTTPQWITDEGICASYADLFEPLTDEEQYLVEHKLVPLLHRVNFGPIAAPGSSCHMISPASLSTTMSRAYTICVNDRESAIVGVDSMRQIKIGDDVNWIESKAISDKVTNYNKLNRFISLKYASELAYGRTQCFHGKNTFHLDKKCNQVLGYCVEYYSKYVIYGNSYLGHFIQDALRESHEDNISDAIVVRACMLKYRQMMIKSFGSNVARLIPAISVSQLVQESYLTFVHLVVTLGTKTADYVRTKLYPNAIPANDVDPNLSIRHISGLADYITHDTILDVKVRNNIDEICVRQVLAYHYLSTKRSDLNIKRVIVYDAVSNRAVEIDISGANLKASSSLDAPSENN